MVNNKMNLNKFIDELLDLSNITIIRMNDKVIIIDNNDSEIRLKIKMINELKE